MLGEQFAITRIAICRFFDRLSESNMIWLTENDKKSGDYLACLVRQHRLSNNPMGLNDRCGAG